MPVGKEKNAILGIVGMMFRTNDYWVASGINGSDESIIIYYLRHDINMQYAILVCV